MPIFLHFLVYFLFFFFFSSRRRHTRCGRDWSSDVCSSDLAFAKAIDKREMLSKRIFNLGGSEACRIDYHEFLSKSFSIFGLGKLDFPKNAFAKQNFHCGYYADGDDLEEFLQFRRDNIESYFKEVKKSVSPLKRFFTRIFNWSVKKHLIRQSDPLKAIKFKDKNSIARYFNGAAKQG